MFRLIKTQRLNDNIIGQAVFIAGIEGCGSWCRCGSASRWRGLRLFLLGRRWLGRDLRGKEGGVALVMAQSVLKKVPTDRLMDPGVWPGVDAHVQVSNVFDGPGNIVVAIAKGHLVSLSIGELARQLYALPLNRLMGKTVQLLQPEGAENGGNGLPGQGQLCAEFVLDFHRHTDGRGKIVRYVPGLQRYRLGAAGESKGQPLGNSTVVLTRAQPAGNVPLVPLCHQMGGQHFPKIIVDAAHIGRQIAGDPAIPRILVQQPLKVFFTLGAEKGDRQRRVPQFHIQQPDARDLKSGIVQIDHIARTVGRGKGVVGRLVRRADDLLDGLPVLIRNGDVNLMGGVSAPDGDGVPLASNGPVREVRGQRRRLFPLCGLLQNGNNITIFFILTEVVQQSAVAIAYILTAPNPYAIRQNNDE